MIRKVNTFKCVKGWKLSTMLYASVPATLRSAPRTTNRYGIRFLIDRIVVVSRQLAALTQAGWSRQCRSRSRFSSFHCREACIAELSNGSSRTCTPALTPLILNSLI